MKFMFKEQQVKLILFHSKTDWIHCVIFTVIIFQLFHHNSQGKIVKKALYRNRLQTEKKWWLMTDTIHFQQTHVTDDSIFIRGGGGGGGEMISLTSMFFSCSPVMVSIIFTIPERVMWPLPSSSLNMAF